MEVMNCWWRGVSFVLVFGSLYVGCRSCNTMKIGFDKFNETGSEMSMLKCEQESEKCDQSFGCRMHVSNKTYTALWQDDWCSTRMMLPDHVYMEKKSVKLIKPVTYEQDGQWLFKSYVPVCIQHGGVIGFSISLKAGWTVVAINLVNKDEDSPMIMSVYETNIVKFRGKLNGTKVNTKQMSLQHVPVLVGVTYLLEIQVLQSSYKLLLNGTQFYEYETTPIDNVPVQTRVSFHDLPSDLHYVKHERADVHPTS